MTRPAERLASYEDLLALPENLVGEILDGTLYTHPRPAPRHAHAYSALGYLIGGPFGGGLDALGLDEVSVLRLDAYPALAVKVRLAREGPTGRYRLYAPFSPPPDQNTLKGTTGHEYRVQPVVFPGWLVRPECKRIAGVWVVEPTALPKLSEVLIG